MIYLLVIAFFTGFLSKLTDLIEEHEMKLSLWVSGLSGIIYGFLIAFVISVSFELSALWIAVVASMIATKKIDSFGHYLGIASLVFSAFFLGIAEINYLFLGVFFVVSVGEELINNKITDAGKIKNKLLNEFMKLRPLLEITALIVSFFSGLWLIWFGLLAFDLGYILIDKIRNRFSL